MLITGKSLCERLKRMIWVIDKEWPQWKKQ